MNNWLVWVCLGGLVLFILGLNFSLITALRRKDGVAGEVWSRFLKSSSAGRAAREKQQADLDELHRRVDGLRKDE